ncbi:MAG: TIGR04348 family glycosyltransferase [Bacteriovorax sp.]|nr:TIGR04348 family glycosyltransferase [Rhizobacter sp.]
MKPRRPTVCIVSPALAAANNGNWQTAARWQRFLAPVADVAIAPAWDGAPADALVALHARRSADSIARFRAAHADAPLALVLTGTDLYRDLDSDASARHSLECASHVVVLQDEGLERLPPAARAKARSIVQSASKLIRHDAAHGLITLVAVGHLRDEKDPLTLMRAARLLAAAGPDGATPAIRVVHIGGALDAALGEQAERTMQACPQYRWLGNLPHASARRWIARSQALVHMSRMEGGANVVIEAVRSGVPVLASRIDGNVGLLGRDYAGYFETGDAQALAALMQRFAASPAFAAHLHAQCALRDPRFAPAAERTAVRALLADLLADGAAAQPAKPRAAHGAPHAPTITATPFPPEPAP